MTRTDRKIIFTALGFLAVILRDDLPQNKRALRASGIADLIESFCRSIVPDAFIATSGSPSSDIAALVEDYVSQLRREESADLSHDRATLLKMYEYLFAEKARHDQKEFYASAHEDIIANRVLQLASEKINREAL